MYVAKTKVLISCTFSVQLICAFVFAYGKSRFSHGAAHFMHSVKLCFSLLVILYMSYHCKTPFFYNKKCYLAYKCSPVCSENQVGENLMILHSMYFFLKNLSRIMRKPTFCICENKDADQLRGNREADQRFCFRYIDSTIPLLSKSEISCL